MKAKVILASVVVIGVLAFTLIASAIGWYDTAIELEEGVKAQQANNRNEYDAFWKKVKEVAQVPDQYKEAFKEILVAETSAKFGENGSQAAFQWFKDRNINFDATAYTKIQTVIEAGRNDFKRAQTELLDKQRRYSIHSKGFFGRMYAGIYDMPNNITGELAPKKDLDGDGALTVLDYPVITSTKTEETFSSGRDDEPVKVF